jgi:acetoin utilization protein AcuB
MSQHVVPPAGDLREAINNTLLSEFMILPPVILKYNESFSKVEAILREKQIKHLPILDENGRLGGLITLSDLYRTCSPRRNAEDGSFVYDKEQLDAFILKNVMTKDPFTLKGTNTLKEALEVMIRGGFGCIPIVDDDHRIRGIITQTDIIRVMCSVLGITKTKMR